MSSFLETQLSITGIKKFYTGASYSKYDLVDYQYYTGSTISPSSVSGLFAWFNFDSTDNLAYNNNGNISTWYNSASSYSNKNLTVYNPNTSNQAPFYDVYNQKLVFKSNSLDSSFNSMYCFEFAPPNNDRCWFVVFEFDSLKSSKETSRYSTVLDIDVYDPASYSQGFFSINGDNGSSNAQNIFIDGSTPSASINSYSTPCSVVKQKALLTILKDNTVADKLIVRMNGYEIINTITATFFNVNCKDLQIGASSKGHSSSSVNYNYDASNISYYEILGYDQVPSDSDILKIEKYLFQKHFTNKNNLYIASSDFTASSYNYSPLNIVGSQYLTRDVDSLFNKTYGCSASFATQALKAQYGDGYYNNVINNTNNLVKNVVFNYDGLTDVQAKSLIGFFQNTFEYVPETIVDPYKSVDIKMFYPYKDNAKIYFSDLDYSSTEANLNSVKIKCKAEYDSLLDYRGLLVTGYDTTLPYSTNKQYTLNDCMFFKTYPLSNQGYYFYSGTSASATGPSAATGPSDANWYFTRKFYFKPDLSFSIPSSPRFKKNEFAFSSPAYQQDGINKNILAFDLTFNNRSDKEALAILKFLDDKAGFKLFEIDLPTPYNKTIKVYCPEWNHTYNFSDNHSINIKIYEFKGYSGLDSVSNTSFGS